MKTPKSPFEIDWPLLSTNFPIQREMVSFFEDNLWNLTTFKDNTNVEEAAQFLVQKIVENDKWSGRLKNIYDHIDGIDLAEYRNSKMELKSGKNCNC